MNKPGLHNDQCLSLEDMRLYQERQLPDKEMHHVEKHLLDCELCSEVLEGLDTQDIPVINSIAEKVNRKVAIVAGMQPVANPSLLSRLKWYFIVPAAIIVAWLAWNRFSSDPDEIKEQSFVAGNQPASPPGQQTGALNSGSLQNVSRDNNSTAPVTVREPQAVEKHVPSPVAEAPAVAEKKPEERIDPPADANKKPKEAEVKVAEAASETNALPIENKAVGNNTESNSKKLPSPEIDHAPLRLIEVKVISKVAAVSGSRKTSKGGQLGGSKAGKVDDGMQPHEMPVFYGGDEAMKTWLIRNFQNPVKDKNELKGKTTAVIFDVSSKGKIDNIEVTKSLSKELDVEVIRLVESMPQWKAASKKGTITVVLAITFK